MNDNYLIPLFLSATVLIALFAFFITIYVLVQKHKQNLYSLEKNKMTYDYQTNLLAMQIEEQERAMDQVSKEIHDNLGQQANFAKMNLLSIGIYAVENRQITIIEKTKTILDGMIKDIQNISHSLNSDFIKDIGFINMLQEELNHLSLSNSISCDIDIIGEDKTFIPDKELLIFRIAQEAIHNVSKHAQATSLQIILTYEPDTFIMTISDNGIGFEKDKTNKLNGIGFLNMLNRAKLLNGTINIDSQPLSGCTITLRVNKINVILAHQINDTETQIDEN